MNECICPDCQSAHVITGNPAALATPLPETPLGPTEHVHVSRHDFTTTPCPLPEGAAPSLDVPALRRAIYGVSVAHDWEHTTDREDRTEEIAAAYLRESLPQPQDET